MDLNGVAFNAGIAKKNVNRHGAFTWGPFFETGSANYDSYLDDGTHGSGDTHYTGGGLLARQEYTNGSYVEGSLRYGRTKADYSGKLLLGQTSYSTSSNYFGGHLGFGRVTRRTNSAATLTHTGRPTTWPARPRRAAAYALRPAGPLNRPRPRPSAWTWASAAAQANSAA